MTVNPALLNSFALLLKALVSGGASALATVHTPRNQDTVQRAARLQNEHRELTIEEVVADPIVCELMRADHVDPDALEALMRSVSARLRVTACK